MESEEKCLERNGWNFLTPEEPATWGAPPCLDVEEFVVDKDAASIRDAVMEHGVAFVRDMVDKETSRAARPSSTTAGPRSRPRSARRRRPYYSTELIDLSSTK